MGEKPQIKEVITLDNQTPQIPQNVTAWETLASFLGRFVNDNTSIGKAGKAGKWAGIAVVIVTLLTTLAAQPALFTALHWGVAFWVINVLAVFGKNLFDPTVKNF